MIREIKVIKQELMLNSQDNLELGHWVIKANLLIQIRWEALDQWCKVTVQRKVNLHWESLTEHKVLQVSTNKD